MVTTTVVQLQEFSPPNLHLPAKHHCQHQKCENWNKVNQDQPQQEIQAATVNMPTQETKTLASLFENIHPHLHRRH